jgi:methylenetetrahydrofolate reductase (NADPH)
MHIADILKKSKTTLSFEFFPPKTDKGFENLSNTIKELEYLDPAYVSVTYGAGGGTRERTHKLITGIQESTSLTVVSHLTCVGHSEDDIYEILENYNKSGISNILALRGDPPTGETNFTPAQNGFNYASELVSFIKKSFPEMGIGVAGFPEGHPTTPNRLLEIDHLKAKVDAGADYICTQLFFDNRDFYDFKERCEIANINIPIIAGIMPITTVANMKKISELSLGARIPAKLLKSIYRAPNDEYVENVGIHWAAEQVNDLIENNVEGIHFYTLNKSKQIKQICESIGLINSNQIS